MDVSCKCLFHLFGLTNGSLLARIGICGHFLVRRTGQMLKRGEGVMTTSSGAKRRRKRERQFLEMCDTVSMRATIVAITATCGFLMLQIARSLITA